MVHPATLFGLTYRMLNIPPSAVMLISGDKPQRALWTYRCGVSYFTDIAIGMRQS